MTHPAETDIQLFYARVLDRGAKAGFFLLLLTFAVYVTGLLAPYVPLEDLPRYWGLPVSEYLLVARVQTGWAWLGELHHGDFLNFLPIAVLAAVSIFGYLAVGNRFFRNRETVMALIVLGEVIVLTLAASGLLKTGGH